MKATTVSATVWTAEEWGSYRKTANQSAVWAQSGNEQEDSSFYAVNTAGCVPAGAAETVRLDSCTLQLPLTGNKSVSQPEPKCAPPITLFQIQAIKFRPEWRSNRATSGWCLFVCPCAQHLQMNWLCPNNHFTFVYPVGSILHHYHTYTFTVVWCIFKKTLLFSWCCVSLILLFILIQCIIVCSDKIMTNSLNSLPRLSRTK